MKLTHDETKDILNPARRSFIKTTAAGAAM